VVAHGDECVAVSSQGMGNLNGPGSLAVIVILPSLAGAPVVR